MNTLNSTQSLVSAEEKNALLSRLLPFQKKLKEIEETNVTLNEAFIYTPFNTDTLEDVTHLVKEKRSPELKYVFVVGIGGSSLGAQAVYQAQWGVGESLEQRIPKLVFFDEIDEEKLNEAKTIILGLRDEKEALLVGVSKTGGTIETRFSFDVLKKTFNQRFPGDVSRIVVISTPNSSWTRESKAEGISTLSLPEHISGRYSAFTAGTLFPLALSGVNISEFASGAQDAVKKTKETDCPSACPETFMRAIALFVAHEKKKNIHNVLIQTSRLTHLGFWWRQLLGESTAKDKTLDGKETRVGILPIISSGKDFHSLFALFIGETHEMYTTFLSSTADSSLIEGDTEERIFNSVKKVFQEKKKQYEEIKLPDTGAYSVGFFMMESMITVSSLCFLFNVNAFDQPAVDSYKKLI